MAKIAYPGCNSKKLHKLQNGKDVVRDAGMNSPHTNYH